MSLTAALTCVAHKDSALANLPKQLDVMLLHAGLDSPHASVMTQIPQMIVRVLFILVTGIWVAFANVPIKRRMFATIWHLQGTLQGRVMCIEAARSPHSICTPL